MMAKKFFLILAIIFTALLTHPLFVSAHLAGQPAFLRINNEYTVFYHVLSSSLSDFSLPQDEMSLNYLAGQTLNFDIDTSKLPVPAEIIKKTKFTWDFADGLKGQGMTLSHAYTKQGSYVLSLFADDSTTSQPQLLDSVFINVLPSKNYTLPKSQIFVNGKSSTDPLAKVLIFDFDKSINFDAAGSSGDGLTYFWDFGDGKSSTGAKIEHTYKKETNIVYPLLRVKDNNGFLSDSFVEVDNREFTNKTTNNDAKSATSEKNNWFKNPFVFIVGGVIMAGLLEFLYLKLKKK